MAEGEPEIRSHDIWRTKAAKPRYHVRVAFVSDQMVSFHVTTGKNRGKGDVRNRELFLDQFEPMP